MPSTALWYKKTTPYTVFLTLLCFGSLVTGALFYLYARPITYFGVSSVTGESLPGPDKQLLIFQSIPSFLHAIATYSMLALLGFSSTHRLVRRWLTGTVVLVLLECSFGTFDLLDLAAIVGALLCCVILHGIVWFVWPRMSAIQPFHKQDAMRPFFSSAGVFMTLGLSSFLALGSYADGWYGCARYDEAGNCAERFTYASPVYMSYSQLRSSVAVEQSRPMDRVGRVYVYQQYIFVSEKNEGIHIIDNAEPAEPVNLGFIRIPGNTDINIRSGYLYADSYVDLVTLDIRDTKNVVEVAREEGIFPYNPTQNVRYNIRLYDYDEDLGVVVGYRVN